MVKLKAASKPLDKIPQTKEEKILKISVADEIQDSYLQYCLASNYRSIPNCVDGLLPVWRRMIWTCHTEGFYSNKPFVKVAKILGSLMGAYHPHSEAASSFENLANSWNNLVPLLNYHGHIGDATSSMASPRYLEGKLRAYSEEVLLKETEALETKPNYDGTLQEPIILNARIPQLLITGCTAISVGYASSCLSHSINEVIDATHKFIETGGKNKIRLLPDFKQGCDVLYTKEVLEQYAETGRASFKLRAKLVSKQTSKEKRTELTKYTFENIPYGTNVEKIGEQIKKAVESGRYGDLQIREIIDESDRTGDRLSVVSKRNDLEEILWASCDLECSVSANNTVIGEEGVPICLGTKEIIGVWYKARCIQVVRWGEKRIEKLKERLHIVEGYLKLLKSKTKAIKLIQDSEGYDDAKAKLIEVFGLTKKQASAILELKLRQITKLNAGEFEQEALELKNEIKQLNEYCENPSKLILQQLSEIKKEFGQKRVCKTILVNNFTKYSYEDSKSSSASARSGKKVSMWSLNLDKGIVEKGAVKGNFVATSSDKIIAIGENGLLYKLGMGHRGPIIDKPLKILWAEKESKCLESDISIGFIGVDEKGRKVGKAVKISELTKATSKGSSIGWDENHSELTVVSESKKLPLKNKGNKFVLLKEGKKRSKS